MVRSRRFAFVRLTLVGCVHLPVMPSSTRRHQANSSLTLDAIRAAVLPIAQAYRARNVRIVGSCARGEERHTSEVDLLVDLPDGMSLLDLSRLKLELEDTLHRKIDVVPARSIKPALRSHILAEDRPL